MAEGLYSRCNQAAAFEYSARLLQIQHLLTSIQSILIVLNRHINHLEYLDIPVVSKTAPVCIDSDPLFRL